MVERIAGEMVMNSKTSTPHNGQGSWSWKTTYTDVPGGTNLNKLLGDLTPPKIIPTVQRPKFGIITPMSYLSGYATQSSFHLVLAHLVDTDEGYADVYKHRSMCGDFIIMDNGAFELGESYAPDELIRLGTRCGADVIVLPDYPLQHHFKTIEASSKLIDKVKDAGFKTMFVPQSNTGDVEGWIEAYKWAASNNNIDCIGMSILGMPNAIPKVHVGFARVVLTQMLLDRGLFNPAKYHHYLGLQNISLELPSLVRMRVLNSCDSSNPVWAGLNGHKYDTTSDSYLSISKKYLREVDFDWPLTKKQCILDIVQHNINIVQDILVNPQNHQ